MVALYSGQYTSIFGVVKCYTSTNSVVMFNYYAITYITTELVLNCATYFTDSDTTKKHCNWPDTNTDTRIGAALVPVVRAAQPYSN